MRRNRRHGVTLVELLVVVSIIAALVALLLPAVQASREAARNTVCVNHLKQMGVAVQSHLASMGHFPSGGWGASWTGDPLRGYGPKQPGGWMYNILDFLEQNPVRRDRHSMEMVIESFICPTRRHPDLFPHENNPYRLINAVKPTRVARSDYAINAGDSGLNHLGTQQQCGPASEADAESGYEWPDASRYTGISYFRSQIASRRVTDGLSHTYLVGEKYLDDRDYETGADAGDCGFALMGYAADTVRLTIEPPRRDKASGLISPFGSAHAGACNFVFCDGSVQAISYDIEPPVHRALGNRQDERTTP
jgi:prepilin-type N-terminal cleavage/methylation domain-containing protein/prepilin-type processing-associated H-X9-DG protein